MGGGNSKFSVSFGPRRGRSQMGGGTYEKNPTEAKTAHLLNAKLGHFLLFGTFELKSSQIWHKNVFKFFKFSGTNLGWGGTSLGPKMGTSVGWGGLAKFSPDGGTPPVPPQEKNPGEYPNSNPKP